jgi:hypothetical protein
MTDKKKNNDRKFPDLEVPRLCLLVLQVKVGKLERKVKRWEMNEWVTQKRQV